jgi:hypothetical protein
MIGYYTGTGDPQTPYHICKLMEEIAQALSDAGYTLRSGHGPGADQAFEAGAEENAQIFLPWPQFEKRNPIHADAFKLLQYTTEARRMAAAAHPFWSKLKDSTKDLITRDYHEILGVNLDRPSDFMICWTRDGAISGAETGHGTGGTGQAIRIAEQHGVPIYNLGRADHLEMFDQETITIPASKKELEEQS